MKYPENKIIDNSHLEFSDLKEVKEFIKNFEEKTLPKKRWTHKAHFIVGLWYLLNYNFEEALNKVRKNIKAYNESKGVANTESSGYHETITVFYLTKVKDFILNSGKSKLSLELFKNILNSPIVDKKYPFEYYSEELLFSKEARFGYIEPDKKF